MESRTDWRRREQELLKLNEDLELKKQSALSVASRVVQEVNERESSRERPRSAAEPQAAAAPAEPAAPGYPHEGRPMEPAVVSAPVALARAAADDADAEELRRRVKTEIAKVKAAKEELANKVRELSEKDAQIDLYRAQEKVALRDATKDKAKIDELEKVRQRLTTKTGELEEQCSGLNAELRRERERYEKVLEEKKRIENESAKKDARMHRLLEDNERLKAARTARETGEKDRNQDTRKEMERLQTEVKTLGRQRQELLTAFRKQMKLIDVLKRQKVHLEAARVLAFTEEEFVRVLELGEKLAA